MWCLLRLLARHPPTLLQTSFLTSLARSNTHSSTNTLQMIAFSPACLRTFTQPCRGGLFKWKWPFCRYITWYLVLYMCIFVCVCLQGCVSLWAVQTHGLVRLHTYVWMSFDWGCQRWLPTQQLEVLGECVSVYTCNVIVVSLKEFLIEVQRQMACIHYSMMGEHIWKTPLPICLSLSIKLSRAFLSSPCGP